MKGDPLLRGLGTAGLRALDPAALRAALAEVLGRYATETASLDRLIPIGMGLATAGRGGEAVPAALAWAGAAPDDGRLLALGHLLQGVWDGFKAESHVVPTDVAALVALRAAAGPGEAADHALLMALAAAAARPDARPAAVPVVTAALSRMPPGRPRDLLAAALRTYLNR